MRLIVILLCFISYSLLSQNAKENIFGFATSNTFTYCDVNDTSFINKVKRLNPKVLRFPGGAVGNFYHFGKNGYGFDFNEIDTYHSGKFPKRARGLDNSRRKKQQNYDYINDFIVLAKATNAKAVLVANMFVNNDDILLMIEKLQANNIKIVGVELGTELSNRSYYKNGYTIDEYLVSAKSYSKKVKDNYPNIKTAIVAAPLGTRKGHRHNVWNNKLSKLDFYDAIVIHSYAKVTKGEDRYGQMISEQVEGGNETEAFEMYKKRAINYLTTDYSKEVQEYVSVFNKPIWVTEWNLQISKTTGNTLLQSLFVAQYFLELLSSPDLSAIEMTTYHNLGGRDFSGSIFRNNKDEMEIQSTYYPMKMIGKIFENDIVRIEKEKKEESFIYKCYNKNADEVLEFFVDWSKKYLLYTSYTDGNPIETIMYKSSNLFDCADKSGVLDLDIFEYCEH